MKQMMTVQMTLLFKVPAEVEKKPWEKDMEELGYIRDKNCTKDVPIFHKPDKPIYGKGIAITPRIPCREDTEHFRKIKLDTLLPLEEYDKIIVLISGGKDSIASYLKLRNLGVPKEKIEFWHHDIDGGHPTRRMDWPCTQNYMKAFAKAEGIPLRVSYRVGGFFGELYRCGASEPVEWVEPQTGEVKRCKPSQKYLACEELKKQVTEEAEELLKEYGYRYKFPAKSPDLSRRWCSAYLKIMVADSVIANLDEDFFGKIEKLKKIGGQRGKFPAKGSTQSGQMVQRSFKGKRTGHCYRKFRADRRKLQNPDRLRRTTCGK